MNKEHLNNPTLSYVKLIASLTLLGIILSFLCFSICGINEPSLRWLIRATAKSSAILFSIAFVASSFYQLSKVSFSASILKYRPKIGLTFGVMHIFHLAFLIMLQYTFHPVFSLANRVSLLGGSVTYLFIFLMMITTFPHFKNKLSLQNWKLLHTVGGYSIWIIFFRSYLKQVMYQERGYVLFTILLVVLSLRIFTLLQRKYFLSS